MNENENLETVINDTGTSGTADTADTANQVSDAVVDVSSGDIVNTPSVAVSSSSSPSPVSAPEAYTVYTVSGGDLSNDTLNSIDGKLTCIIFLIAFIWAAHHIRNAVRSFTGRNIDK